MKTTKKEEYARVGLTMQKQLLQRLDKYCGGVKIRSAVVRQAIEEFLNRRGKKGGDV